MPPRTPTDVNYAVLRRYLPRLHEILTIATYAHIYIWSSSSNSWSKGGLEGSLFLVSLNPPTPTPTPGDPTRKTEEYMLFLLNRCSIHNWYYHLRNPDNVDLENEEFCILRANDPITNGNETTSNGGATSPEEDEQLAYGLFIFSEQNTSTAEDKEKFLRMTKECATTYQATSAAAALPTPVPPPEPQQQTQAGRSISLTELFQPTDTQLPQQQYPGYYTQSGWGYQDMGTGGQQQRQQPQVYHDQFGSAGMGVEMGAGNGNGNGNGGDVLMNLFQRASDARSRVVSYPDSYLAFADKFGSGGGPTQGY